MNEPYHPVFLFRLRGVGHCVIRLFYSIAGYAALERMCPVTVGVLYF